ncbi:MAG TPA: SDR family oxidoreductase [Stellaceae bacterium]|nr:SDR family oxidoreductase [Stellaceae bacterium]
MNAAAEASPVLIVGAGSDIGRAIAIAYAKARRPLVLTARQPERLERDAADLRLRYDAEVTTFGFDLLDTAAHRLLIEQLAPFPGTVICVAGLLGRQEEAAADPAQAELIMRTNYLAPSLFLGEIANRMAPRGSGTIIGISSVAGDRGRATNYLYGSAKAGFTAFLSGLRNRLATSGVHVVTIKPGFVNTRMTQGMKLPPLLTAQPDEVGRAVLQAETAQRDIVYVRTIWWPIMMIICLLPERLFKRMRL